MSDSFVIQWKSKANGRIGRGAKTFNREDGEVLITELNAEYPEIVHELVRAPDISGQGLRAGVSAPTGKPLGALEASAETETPAVSQPGAFSE